MSALHNATALMTMSGGCKPEKFPWPFHPSQEVDLSSIFWRLEANWKQQSYWLPEDFAEFQKPGVDDFVVGKIVHRKKKYALVDIGLRATAILSLSEINAFMRKTGENPSVGD